MDTRYIEIRDILLEAGWPGSLSEEEPLCITFDTPTDSDKTRSMAYCTSDGHTIEFEVDEKGLYAFSMTIRPSNCEASKGSGQEVHAVKITLSSAQHDLLLQLDGLEGEVKKALAEAAFRVKKRRVVLRRDAAEILRDRCLKRLNEIGCCEIYDPHSEAGMLDDVLDRLLESGVWR